MTLTHFTFDLDEDGIALVTWDSPGRAMNVIDQAVIEELERVVERVASDEAIKGAAITSGKETFSGGADITLLQGLGRVFAEVASRDGEEVALAQLFEESRKLSLLYRRLETSGKPWVAAINGTAMGGAFELALACHHRVAAQNPKARVGLPEIKIGLFPGAGGTQRVARLMPPGDALQMLLKGDALRLDRAKAMKLIDAVVPPAELVAAAKAWIKQGGSALAPWDRKGFKPPGGPVYSKAGMMVFPPANAIYRRETGDNYPAARAIMQVVFEGLQLPMDAALRVESRHFTKVLRSPQAAAMMRTLFVSLGALNKGARRPAGVPPKTIAKVGIVGAGFMGAGIAYVSAQAGLEVVLIDRDQDAAEKGKAQSHKLVTEQVNKGRAKTADRDALLARITPTTDFAALKGCDLVIEAVFEDRAVKAETIRRAEAAIEPAVIFGSNTSTLPITSLARESRRPANVVGIHFFSPVEKMMLVEVIRGEQTSEEALASALDFVRAIKKTPIVVNDARGFYTSRVVGTFLREGHLMLAEGLPPAMIENVACMAGMPVGPLALSDEVALDLCWKILKATEADLGGEAIDAGQKALLAEMVEKRGRLGRKNRKGFYDYPESGAKSLWPGLADLQPRTMTADEIDEKGDALVTEMKRRLLAIQALETARCFAEGVLTDPREADVGSILGFGFAPFSGGTLSCVDMMGVGAFVALCERLAETFGPRFAPPPLLREMAAKNESFYGRFAPERTQAAA